MFQLGIDDSIRSKIMESSVAVCICSSKYPLIVTKQVLHYGDLPVEVFTGWQVPLETLWALERVEQVLCCPSIIFASAHITIFPDRVSHAMHKQHSLQIGYESYVQTHDIAVNASLVNAHSGVNKQCAAVCGIGSSSAHSLGILLNVTLSALRNRAAL